MNTIKSAVFVLIVFVSTSWSINKYPEWFIFPQKYPSITVGYTYNGMPALFDAANMYCAYKACAAVGTLEIFEDAEHQDLLKNSNYYYYFSPDEVEQIYESFFEIDRFTTKVMTGDQIAAFSFTEEDTVEYSRLEAAALERPAWIDSSFMDDGRYYYGVGMYTSKGNENDGWKTAEEQGIFAVLNALAMQIYKIETTSDEGSAASSNEFESIMVLKFRFLIKNIEVVERYPDNQDRMHYALMRIPKQSIRSKMIE